MVKSTSDSDAPAIAFETAGNPANPALLLVHGFMSCNAQWMANLEHLTQHYHLVMAELWGHGHSPTPTDAEFYSVTIYAKEFERIRSELAIKSWCVIGQSYGAGVVINYALKHPSACQAVIVTNSRSAFGQVTPPPADENRASTKPAFDPRKLPYHPIHARRFPAGVKDALVAQADKVSARAVAMGGLLTDDLQSTALISKLTQPLLIANGEYEKSFQQDLQKLQQQHADLNIVNLPGGHSVNVEAAEDFNTAVHHFITEQANAE